MNTEEALAILDEVFSERVPATSPTWSRQVSLSFSEGEPPTAHMTMFDEDECTGSAWQPLELLPAGGDVDPDRYRAFAEGVRAGMGAHIARYEGMTGPCEFFLVDLLRDPALRTPADFAAAVSDDAVQARSLGPIRVGDFTAKHGLPPIADVLTIELLWSILTEQSTSDAAALRLVGESRIEAIPLLVVLLDAWVDRGIVQMPEWFLGGENGHTKLARLLEPLARRTEDASYIRRIEGMAEAGLFRLE